MASMLPKYQKKVNRKVLSILSLFLNDFLQRVPKKRARKQFRGFLRRRTITGNLRNLSQGVASQMAKIVMMKKNITTFVQRPAPKRNPLRTPMKVPRTMKTHQKVQKNYTTKHQVKMARKGRRNNMMKAMKKTMRKTTKRIPKAIIPQSKFYLRFQMSYKTRSPTATMLLAPSPTHLNKAIVMFLP